MTVMSHDNIPTIVTNEPTSDSQQTAFSPEQNFKASTKQLDVAISELLTARGELHLANFAHDSAMQDFTLARQFNNENSRAFDGQRTAIQSIVEPAKNTPEIQMSSSALLNNPLPSQSTFRIDSGYRVMATYPHNDFDEDQRPLEIFPNTKEGRRHAIANAKSIARDPSGRQCLDNNYQIDDPEFTAAVQKFHCLVETIALIAPQEQLDSIEFPFLPAQHPSQQAIVAPIKTQGRWNCLLLEGAEEANTPTFPKADDLECQIQSTEAIVNATASAIKITDTAQLFHQQQYSQQIYKRLCVACQCALKAPTQDDLIRTLLGVPGLPVQTASTLVEMLQKAHGEVYGHVLSIDVPIIELLPAKYRNRWDLDLQAFIYEKLLVKMSRTGSSENRETPELVGCL